MLIIWLLFIAASAGDATAKKCDKGWVFYAAENVCIFHKYEKGTYLFAEKGCKELKANLVIIMDLKKQQFLHKTRSSKESDPYWIGVRQTETPELFAYVNGSYVGASGVPNIPRWASKKGKFDGYEGHRKQCVVLHGLDWIYRWCQYNQYGFACERKLMTNTKWFHPRAMICKTTCGCDLSKWEYIEHAKKYIAVNQIKKPFVDSMKFCQSLGGNMLTKPDEGTVSFLKNLDTLKTPKYFLYYIGMRRFNNKWEWLDGTPVDDSDDNWQWSGGPEYDEAVVMWDFDTQWRLSKRGSYAQICEATDPCPAHPVIEMNDRPQDANSTVAATFGWIKLSCSYPNPVLTIKWKALICGKEVKSNVTGLEPLVVSDLYIHIDVVPITCECQIRIDDKVKRVSLTMDGKYDATSLYVGIKETTYSETGTGCSLYVSRFMRTRPSAEFALPKEYHSYSSAAVQLNLVNKLDRYKKIVYKTGHHPTFQYLVNANPAPLTYLLTYKEHPVPVSEYVVSFIPTYKKGQNEYRVGVVVVLDTIKRLGSTYRLTIGNGSPNYLVIKVTFQEQKTPNQPLREDTTTPKDEDNSALIIFFTVIFLLSLTLSLGAVCICGGEEDVKRRPRFVLATARDSIVTSISSHSDNSKAIRRSIRSVDNESRKTSKSPSNSKHSSSSNSYILSRTSVHVGKKKN